MTKQSNVPLLGAAVANFLEAVIKFIAAFGTGSAAMLSEAVHSSVDLGNGLLMLLGTSRSKKAADKNHPFGYGKEIYFWTLIVSLIIFILGGGVSVYTGVSHFIHPEELRNPVWNYVVIGVSFFVESVSFTIAFRKFREETGHEDFWHELHQSKDPSTFAVIYEDGASLLGLLVALAGVLLSHYLHQPKFDAAASILIGIIIAFVALIMIFESRNLLVGESARSDITNGIKKLVKSDTDIVTLSHPLTMHMSPNEILLAMDVQFKKGIDTKQMSQAIERLEKSIRHQFPEVKKIYIEVKNLAA